MLHFAFRTMDKLRKFLDMCLYKVDLFSLFLSSSISVKQMFALHVDCHSRI